MIGKHSIEQQQQSKDSSITYRIELYDDDNNKSINRLIEQPLQSSEFVVHIDRQYFDNDHHDDDYDDNQKIIGHFSVQLLDEPNSTTTTTTNHLGKYRIKMIAMVNKNRLLKQMKMEEKTLYSKHRQQQMLDRSMNGESNRYYEHNDDADDDEWIIISNEEILFNASTIINDNRLQSFKSTATNSKSVYTINDDYDDKSRHVGQQPYNVENGEKSSGTFVVVGKNFVFILL